jgi:hypothetical protein
VRDSPLEIISTKEHSHAPEPREINRIQVFNQMKRQAVDHPEMSPQIIRNRFESV